MEEIKEFYVKDTKLTGILHTPNTIPSRKNLLIIVPYGLNTRVGPHRFYVRIARHLCDRGYFVFRFDGLGCGDSDGDIAEFENLHRDDVFWRLVWRGDFIDDVNAAIGEMKESVVPDAIVVGGICGGAIRAILSGQSNGDVDSVILSSFPSTIDDVSLDNIDKMGVSGAKLNLSMYMNKIFSPASWIRFFAMKSDYRRINKAVTVVLKSLNNKYFQKSCGEKKGNKEFDQEKRKVNYQLIGAISDFIKQRKKILIIYGENDRYREDFEMIMENKLKQVEQSSVFCEKFIVKKSNHEFSFEEWQKDYVAKITNWLCLNYPTKNE